MQLSAQLTALPGVSKATAVMATEGNLALLRESGVSVREIDAGPSDLLLVVEGDETAALEKALIRAEDDLNRPLPRATHFHDGRLHPRTVEMGVQEMPGANLALISVPGEYASAEALKALRLGLNVMLFSANVDEQDEVALKHYAREHGLLVMGPDCGTAVINGIPLGFANAVRRGNMGIVAASGTGLQEVTVLIDRAGGGISQAIGTGGHDFSEWVGGISTIQGLDVLAEDEATKVIVLMSKAPSPRVAQAVIAKASRLEKPVVVNFLGADPRPTPESKLFFTRTLEETANTAITLGKGQRPGPSTPQGDTVTQHDIAKLAGKLAPDQRYVRGLYSGGTLCAEATLILKEALGVVYGNTLEPGDPLPNLWTSDGHTLIDLGDPRLTRGRPHPMIDCHLRNERIVKEARDPQVAVILLDIVLGYGAHMDPAGALCTAIGEAHHIAARHGRQLIFVAHVCGTEADPQDLSKQEALLRKTGVMLAPSNAAAARLAAQIIGP